MLINFVILYGLVKIFEKDNDADWFQVLAAAAIPAILTNIFSFALALIEVPLWLSWTPLLVLAGLTFVVLRKILDIPSRRAMALSVTLAVLSMVAQVACVAARAA